MVQILRGALNFIRVDSIFERYTIIVDLDREVTHVYCTECDEQVVAYKGEQVTTNTEMQLYDAIIEKHDEQVRGAKVEIADPDRKI
jgi:hypothetical protein